ncbi:nitric oxide synthase-related protein [Babesia gibsoni]|uniref:NADPH--hemoprotein reductase n=1 Tax=Babesia gibsoni TaxID=33632 RepID=A0AAD8LHX1_BABGI|nr:nitric oxide synthase-related protein [Babesia gibsoni]
MSYGSHVTVAVATGLLAAYLLYRLWSQRQRSPELEEGEDGSEKAPSIASNAARGCNIVIPSGVYVYYGSQTGTAERLAKELAALLAKWSPVFHPEALNLEDWKEGHFAGEGTCVIFLVSTHDDGLFPDNALNFVKWLRKCNKEGKALDSLRFCVFGLGSSEYALFNQASKNLQRIMKQLGAYEFMSISFGNESIDLKKDFQLWKTRLLETLVGELNLEPLSLEAEETRLTVVPNDTWRNRVPLELRYVDSVDVKQDFEPKASNVICKQQWMCSDHVVLENIRLTPEDDGKTHCIVTNAVAPFKAAETANVLYANPPDVVQYFIAKLKLKEADLEKYITFVPRYGKRGEGETFDAPFPVPCTIQDALRYYLDLTSLPSVEVLRDLGSFLKTKEECELYNGLLDSEALLKRMRQELFFTLPEYIEVFMPRASFNLGGFLQIVPKKVPRPYTISSHPSEEKIYLTVKLVQHVTHSLKSFKKTIERGLNYKEPVSDELFKKRRFYKGACTHFLCSLEPGEIIKMYRRPSAFTVDGGRSGKPAVMIANGAGVAPFRALWHNTDHVNQHILFLGFRDAAHILYKDELEELSQRDNFTVHIALSREKERIYVQHLVKDHIASVNEVINNEGVIYLCGSKQMGAQVKAILEHFLKIDIAAIKTSGQYVEELW